MAIFDSYSYIFLFFILIIYLIIYLLESPIFYFVYPLIQSMSFSFWLNPFLGRRCNFGTMKVFYVWTTLQAWFRWKFSLVWDCSKAMSLPAVKCGFKETSINTFNPNAIPEEAFVLGSASENLLPMNNGAKSEKIQGHLLRNRFVTLLLYIQLPFLQTVAVIVHFLKIMREMMPLFKSHHLKNYSHHHRKSVKQCVS